MKLTVGPLPSGVYWRRRAIVGGVLVAASLMLWASCGGSGGDDQKRTPAAASAGATTAAAPDPTITIQVPTTGGATANPAPVQTTTAASAPAGPTAPPCADADLSLIATPEQAVQFRGAHLKMTLKIKNITDHECTRDVGADAQELYLQVGAVKIWSSDQCDAVHGNKLQVMKPGIEWSFTATWAGKATNTTCVNGETPPAGKYELMGRLGTKFSEPVQVQLT
ncbi:MULTISPECIES: hypothetical protein [Dactylosporangium]|uniref:DUF4232 domain-containing protein n=2 Tax=Dactylosporangium TaxID=35753 RepID=A0A9W6KCM1_9ACTN|nr:MULTISPECIES: hypothetical protein [Dactylosporangium]UAB96883.1 hypothetical protein Dvina_01225 [Dactylosporangium vinaceum]UWZ45218.1 hypothetical protein Dmats_01270 [Dactylosporangium matsuzakiense]GLK98817.1 hypothetical protein GCM10017581_005580 [Dactylosporangium matsuzakiense]